MYTVGDEGGRTLKKTVLIHGATGPSSFPLVPSTANGWAKVDVAAINLCWLRRGFTVFDSESVHGAA